MRTLATAKPNTAYRYWHNLSKTRFEIHLKNNVLSFVEINETRTRVRPETFFHQFFNVEGTLVDQPFLIKENRNFFTVLNRHKVHYKERYKKLKNPNI